MISLVKRFILLILLLFSNVAYSEEMLSNGTLQKLANAEWLILGHTNKNYSIEKRINNLENKVFGTTQPGDYQSRIDFLFDVIVLPEDNLDNQYKRYRANKPLNLIKQALIQSQGIITGYTPPPVNPLPNFDRPHNINKNIPPRPYKKGIDGNTKIKRFIRTY